jgi:hypothetical protein
VCYLPPIEMMTVGGPVIYQRGSLLARYFGTTGPGEASSVDEAKRKMQLLLTGDRAFVDELRDAQRPVARRYHPDHVHPIFDRVFRQLIDRRDMPRQEPAVLSVDKPSIPCQRTYVFQHVPGDHVAFDQGAYYGTDAIAWTVKKAVFTLLEDTGHEVVVTCFANQLPCLYGYLTAAQFGGRLRFQVLDEENVTPRQFKPLSTVVSKAPAPPAPSQPVPAGTAVAAAAPPAPALINRALFAEKTKRAALASLRWIAQYRVLLGLALALAGAGVQMFRLARRARQLLTEWNRRAQHLKARCLATLRGRSPWMLRRDCVEAINAQTLDAMVIVPHGSRFPETFLLTKPLIICLPDEAEAPRGGRMHGRAHALIGRWLAEKAAAVLPVGELRKCRLLAARASVGPHHFWPASAGLQAVVSEAAHSDGIGQQADADRHPDLVAGVGGKS